MIIQSIEQRVLLYQVYSNRCLYNNYIFLYYRPSMLVLDHLRKQQVLFLRVFLFFSSLSSTDVPFTNGVYTYRKFTFYDLSSSSIQYDSSTFLLIHFIHSIYISQRANLSSLIRLIMNLFLMIQFCFLFLTNHLFIFYAIYI